MVLEIFNNESVNSTFENKPANSENKKCLLLYLKYEYFKLFEFSNTRNR